MKKQLLAASLVLAMAFTFGCGSDKDDDGGDQNLPSGGGSACVSGTVSIGNQCWQKSNSNINPSVGTSKCYANLSDNCDKYGRLYDWEAAKSACPQGFHLPSDAEWTALTNAVGGADITGTKLKATSGWDHNGNGTDDYGFSALPGGIGFPGGIFLSAGAVGSTGDWWSSTEYDASHAYNRNMYYGLADVSRGNSDKTSLLSVRCVQN